jgi:DNA-binding GntR family transcriptional regulator
MTDAISLQHPETLASAVAKAIKDAIVVGRFHPGQRLPEVALSNELKTSRGTIREALRMLADTGLVDVRPRRGVFVSELTHGDAWEITSLRALQEPYAARLAIEASGGNPKHKADVHAAFDRLCEAIATSDPIAVADADVAFHRSVFARCGHTMLLDQLANLQVLARRVVLTNQLLSADAPTLIGQHQVIVDAVDSSDPDQVEAAVRVHVIEGGELLLARVSRLARESGTPVDQTVLGSWPGRSSR